MQVKMWSIPKLENKLRGGSEAQAVNSSLLARSRLEEKFSRRLEEREQVLVRTSPFATFKVNRRRYNALANHTEDVVYFCTVDMKTYKVQIHGVLSALQVLDLYDHAALKEDVAFLTLASLPLAAIPE